MNKIFYLINNRYHSKSYSQWDKDIYGKEINFTKEVYLTWVGMAVTIAASLLFFFDISRLTYRSIVSSQWENVIEQVIFIIIFFFLIYGNILYQFTRRGYMKRLLKHRPASWNQLEQFFSKPAPALTILIPSYKEETEVIRQSLLSSALQIYPDKRVVLLIDDPPNPKNPSDLNALLQTTQIVKDTYSLFNEQRDKLTRDYSGFLQRIENGRFDPCAEAIYLSHSYTQISDWFKKQIPDIDIENHADELFIEKILLDSVRYYDQRSKEMRESAARKEVDFSEDKFILEYKKIVGIFNVEITSFQRKRYENLSHEPNKAMNLNSYIGLMGKNYAEIKRGNKIFLEETDLPDCTEIPSSDFLITLDADSILMPDYAIRLIHIMEQKENSRYAVVQTPYSAFPSPCGLLERVAGATTDMQYLIHQGFTHYQSTYWVGANALLRTKSLVDICEETMERGYPVKIFIQDRTVIEDTESTINMVDKGWKLFNYPARLSYSATPPDFGSLIIQRARWANGGLIILPKLLRFLARGPQQWKKAPEGFFRLHYLFSIAAVNIGLPILLFYPFSDDLSNIWLPLTSLPYYYFCGRDLIQAGYNFRDLFRVYALNLLLIQVNLEGVFKSIHQSIVKHKIPFKRTPKIADRTVTPVLHLILAYSIVLYLLVGFCVDFSNSRWMHATFSLFNAGFFIYAIRYFIGFKETYEDMLEWKSKPKPIQPILTDYTTSQENIS